MSTTTVRTKAANIYKDWHVIDAADRPLGRVATEAARLIRGKHKPTFEPHLDDGDFVIVVNASKVRLTGRKSETKRYYRHSGYPGGLKERTFEQMMAAFPERVIEQAVWGMLPSGPLGRRMIKHLKVYRGPEHPHQSQVLGSERARQQREAALQEAIAASNAKKPPRLRPLPVPAEVAAAAAAARAEAEAAAAPEVEAEAPAPARTRRKKSEPKAAAEAPSEAPADEAEASAAEAAAPTETEETPKPARRTRSRKAKAEDTAAAEAESEANEEAASADEDESADTPAEDTEQEKDA